MAQHNTHTNLIIGYLALTIAIFGSIQTAYSDNQEFLRPEAIPAPLDNPLTPERIALGEALFFDPRLSGKNEMSCASCHQPDKGWASNSLVEKIGTQRVMHQRSVPTLINVAYQRHFSWIGRFRTLEQQILEPLTHADEMNQDTKELINELNQIEDYRKMFELAYPGDKISIKTITKAIASFERSLVSTEAPFDRWIKGDEVAISQAAKQGFKLFEGKANCIACHHGFNFTDNSFHNSGVTGSNDLGRFSLIPIKSLKGAFKTPTLRNVTKTAPYMHSGKYLTLEEVIKHYNRGGDVKPPIDPNIVPLFLTEMEEKNLLAFLKTLTDIETPTTGQH